MNDPFLINDPFCHWDGLHISIHYFRAHMMANNHQINFKNTRLVETRWSNKCIQQQNIYDESPAATQMEKKEYWNSLAIDETCEPAGRVRFETRIGVSFDCVNGSCIPKECELKHMLMVYMCVLDLKM